VRSRMLGALAALCVVAIPAGLAGAQPDWNSVGVGETIEVTLANGDVLIGRLISRDDDSVILEHPLIGPISIPALTVESVAPGPEGRTGEAPPPEGEQAEGGEAPDAEADAEEEVAPEEEAGEWEFAIDAGVNGASGNTDDFNARLRFGSTLTSERNEFDAYALYLYSEENDVETKNRAELSARNDFLFKDSPWRLFIRGLVEFDEQRAYDVRISGNAGVAYEFVDTERLTWIGRLGVGASQEFGSENDDITPELFIGTDVRYQVDDRQTLRASAEYFPSLENFTDDYRVRALAAYELQLDQKGNLFLQAGVENRYDNVVEGDVENNDFEYFVTLSYRF